MDIRVFEQLVVTDEHKLPKSGNPAILYYFIDTEELGAYAEIGSPFSIIKNCECNLYIKPRDQFPAVGSAQRLYYATDLKEFFYYDTNSKSYRLISSYSDNYRILDKVSDLPSEGDMGVLYYIRETREFYLYIGSYYWQINNTARWQYVDTLPDRISDLTNLIFVQKNDCKIQAINDLYELIPIKARIFTDRYTYTDYDLSVDPQVVVHTGIHSNIPIQPQFDCVRTNVYSLQTIVGATPEQVKSIASLQIYNYYCQKLVYDEQYICLNNNYNNLKNKPKINGVTLENDLTGRQLGLNNYRNLDYKPSINGRTLDGINYSLTDLGVDKFIADIFYPVGSVYLSLVAQPPRYGQWVLLQEGVTLWSTVTPNTGGEYIPPGIPNISGEASQFQIAYAMAQTYKGALSQFGFIPEEDCPDDNVDSSYGEDDTTGFKFLASDGECGTWDGKTGKPVFENNVYGKSKTVQPPAVKVYMYKRTA